VRVIATGFLERELGYEEGPDPYLSVGSKVVMKAMFDDSRFEWNDYRNFDQAILYGLRTTGKEYWRIDAGGMTWSSFDDLLDGEYGGPSVSVRDGKVVGLYLSLYPAGGAYRPILSSDYSDHTQFKIVPGRYTYGNIYPSPGYAGRWHNIQVLQGVPEPATWAMMIVGFGMTGAALRGSVRNRRAVV
jgi:hypothetical protein